MTRRPATDGGEATRWSGARQVGPLLLLDDDRHGRSEGSAGHPTRALPPAEIDLPEGGAAAAAEA